MKTRREFIRSSALGAASAAILPPILGVASAAGSSGTPVKEPVSSPKKNAITEGHRNLFNGDSCVYFYNPELWQPEGGPYSAKAIHRFVDGLADNGIDTFLINANASTAWYPTKAVPTILDGYKRGDREFFRGHALQGGGAPAEVEKRIDSLMAFMNLYQDLLDAGVDWLAETAKACQQRAVSPWVSLRMNDMHGSLNFEGSFFNTPLLKNPEMRLRQGRYCPTIREPWARHGLNYERHEVRALMFAQIKDVVENYDFEGLELDWWRCPLCCEPEAKPETVAMITDWIREIRALTERRASRNGRIYPLGLRIPGRLETLKSIGLDVVALCREGTLDFVSPSNFWCTSWDMPHDALRERLGERIAIYGVIEDGANTLATQARELNYSQPVRPISSSREIQRADAAGKLVLGADGIEWYNFFCTDSDRLSGLTSDYASLRDIHRLEHLRGLPKHYMLSTSGGGPSWNIFFPPFELPQQLPVRLENGYIHPFRLAMCAEPLDRGLELIIQIVLKASDTVTYLPVSFNGCWPRLERTRSDRLLFPCGSLTHHIPDNAGYDFRFPVSLVRDGWNQVVVENGGDQAVTVVCLELAVRR